MDEEKGSSKLGAAIGLLIKIRPEILLGVIIVACLGGIIFVILMIVQVENDDNVMYDFICLNGGSSNIYFVPEEENIDDEVTDKSELSTGTEIADEDDETEQYLLEEYLKCYMAKEIPVIDNFQYMKAAAITARTYLLNEFGDTGTPTQVDENFAYVIPIIDTEFAKIECKVFNVLPEEKKEALAQAVDQTKNVVLYKKDTTTAELLDVEFDVCRANSDVYVIDGEGLTVPSMCTDEAYIKLKSIYGTDVSEMNEYITKNKTSEHYNGLDLYGSLFLTSFRMQDAVDILEYYFDGELGELDDWLKIRGVNLGDISYGPEVCGMGDDYPIIVQCDSRWANYVFYKRPNEDPGTLCTGGCGPTSVTVVVAGLTPFLNINTPPDLIEALDWWGIAADFDSKLNKVSNGLVRAKAFSGFNTQLSIIDGRYVLAKGSQVVWTDFPDYPIIIYVTATIARARGVAIKNPDGITIDNGKCKGLRFTGAGHFMVIVGIAENGELVIRDPGHTAPNYETFSLECINGWVVTYYTVYIDAQESW